MAGYIIRGQDNQDAFLPTSVFLATDKPLHFDSTRNEITFNPNIVGPFRVVDGQHRLEGLKMASKKVVEKGEVKKALKMVIFLNEEEGSPWLGKIRMANETNGPTHKPAMSVEVEI